MHALTLSKKNFLKSIATLLAIIMATNTVAVPIAQASTVGQPAPINKFSIPESIGLSVEVYAPSKSSRLVYHLQDIHNNVPAQINLAQIVTQLDSHAAKQNKSLLVAVEGMTGQVNWDAVTQIPDQKTKEDVASALLRAGYMLGEEYAVMNSRPGRIKIVGLETPALYQQNLDARKDSSVARKRVVRVMAQTRSQLQQLAPHNFNELLTSLEKKRIAAEEGTLPLGEYVQFLKSVNAGVIAQHPNLARLARLNQEEAAIDFVKVEKEGRLLVQEVMASKSEKEMDRMLADAKALKEGRLSPLSYYSALLNQTRRDFSHVRRYVEYLRASDAINADQLFDETLQAEAEIAVKMIKHPLARQLFDHIRWAELQERFFSLNMIPQEWAVQRRNSVSSIAERHQQVRDFVAEQVADLGYKFTTPSLPAEDLDTAYAGARGFYDAATTRDNAMVQNLMQILSGSNPDKEVVAFIAGGFHTPGMTKLLRSNGLAYEVVRPQIETGVELSQEINIASRRVSYLRDTGVGAGATAAAVAAAQAGNPGQIEDIAKQVKPDEVAPTEKPEDKNAAPQTPGEILKKLSNEIKNGHSLDFAVLRFLPLFFFATWAFILWAMRAGIGGQSGDSGSVDISHFPKSLDTTLSKEGHNISIFQDKFAALVAELKDKEVADPVAVAVDVDKFTGSDDEGFMSLYSALNKAASLSSQPSVVTVMFSGANETDILGQITPKLDGARKNLVAGVQIDVAQKNGTHIPEVLESVPSLKDNLPEGRIFVLGAADFYSGADSEVYSLRPVEQAVHAFVLGRYGKQNADAISKRYLDLLFDHFKGLENGHFTEELIRGMVTAIMA